MDECLVAGLHIHVYYMYTIIAKVKFTQSQININSIGQETKMHMLIELTENL